MNIISTIAGTVLALFILGAILSGTPEDSTMAADLLIGATLGFVLALAF